MSHAPCRKCFHCITAVWRAMPRIQNHRKPCDCPTTPSCLLRLEMHTLLPLSPQRGFACGRSSPKPNASLALRTEMRRGALPQHLAIRDPTPRRTQGTLASFDSACPKFGCGGDRALSPMGCCRTLWYRMHRVARSHALGCSCPHGVCTRRVPGSDLDAFSQYPPCVD